MSNIPLSAKILLVPSLLKDLNPIQQEACQATEGPVLILAGAGSGKTRVLTYRVAYLMAGKKIPPENILVVTFTNKAAGEMKARIISLISSSAHPVMGTFHSICARILRKEGYLIGLKPGFSIYDEGDALDVVKEAMSNLNIANQKLSPSAVRHTISGAKNEMINSFEYPRFAKGFFQETVAKVYLEYQKILGRNQALDFDDLLMETIRLFQVNPETLNKYQIQFRYILVDEYQDTNAAQYHLINLLAKRYKNLCVVGDASQAIYGFRGADFRNIVNFKRDYPNVKIFNLEQNYRSTQIILDAAHSVISENKSHPILKLWTEKSGGEKITVYQAKTEVEEAMFIAQKVRGLVGANMGDAEEGSRRRARSGSEDGRRDTAVAGPMYLSDIAILYRTNAQSRSLEEVFLKLGLPYKLFGGVQFYERKEIKDVLAYLKLAQNPSDSVAKKRIEKLGKGRAQKFYELLNEINPRGDSEGRRGSTLTADFSRTAGTRNALKNQRVDAEQLTKSGLQGQSTLELLDLILQKTGYLETLDDGTEAGKSRIENVKELRSVAEEFPDLVKFLENVALVQDNQLPESQKGEDARDAVSLMTIHASKGLEFPVVFLVGMEEGLFPHSRSMLNPEEMEEERRLAYVGITRSKSKLFCTYTRSRLYFGQRSNNLVSRFLTAIPEELIDSRETYRGEDEWSEDVSSSLDDDDWLNP